MQLDSEAARNQLRSLCLFWRPSLKREGWRKGPKTQLNLASPARSALLKPSDDLMHTFSEYWATLQNLTFSNVALCLSMYIHGHYPKLTQGVFTRVATKGDLTPAFGFSIHSSIMSAISYSVSVSIRFSRRRPYKNLRSIICKMHLWSVSFCHLLPNQTISILNQVISKCGE